ncbi:AAT family amino acid transporter, variant [Plectosphaerella plurivora]|uniref:AAT family amino acid transporter, variant n=1 Tax=Plectosphaerella plurivora TaxID=936078 RepID=A0A9P8V283_9PEZI|nr:AAT family amino acid transporter, variant [Plectosphaerella plurivora]
MLRDEDTKKDLEVGGPLVPQQSILEAESTEHDNRNGQFHRSFSPRQVHIIALGSNIGSGVFIGTGGALSNGGPGNMVLAYGIVCTCVWAVLQTLSEMTIAFPTSGNFIDYADRWVDPALAFGAGFAEWLGWTAIIAAEAVFCDILVNFWADGAVPAGAIYTLFIVATYAIFCLPNTVFAWFEYVTSLVKIALYLIILFLSLALVCGAGPAGKVHNGSTWTELNAFKNGFAGFANAALLATWAVGDQVFIGIMGGEAQSPRFSMAHATKLVPFRVGFVYMLSVMFITLLIRSDDERLLGGSGVTSSPFVIATLDAQIPVIGDILNAGMIVGILAISAESVYISSRVLRTLAHKQLLPEFLAKVDSQGRPRWAIAITCAAGAVFTYINLAAGGRKVFSWLISITSASFFSMWIIIAFTSWRFHKALKAQKDPLFQEVFAWKSTAWPLAPGWLMATCMVLLISCFYVGANPLRGTGWSAENFFQYTFGIILIVFCTAMYKICLRTPWRDPATADLITGRRHLSEQEIQDLKEYYAMSKLRRFGTYVQLW